MITRIILIPRLNPEVIDFVLLEINRENTIGRQIRVYTEAGELSESLNNIPVGFFSVS